MFCIKRITFLFDIMRQKLMGRVVIYGIGSSTYSWQRFFSAFLVRLEKFGSLLLPLSLDEVWGLVWSWISPFGGSWLLSCYSFVIRWHLGFQLVKMYFRSTRGNSLRVEWQIKYNGISIVLFWRDSVSFFSELLILKILIEERLIDIHTHTRT